MNACPWTLPSSRGHREIDVYVQSCARLLVCVFVCMRVRICVCVSLSLFHFLSLTPFFSICLTILVYIYPFTFLSFSCSLSCSLYLNLCISVFLSCCVAVSLCLCVFVLMYAVIYQILPTNLTKRPVVLHRQSFTHCVRAAGAYSVIIEEVAVYAVLISTVRSKTQEPTGLWGNGSYLKSICSTTGVQPGLKCVYVCSLAVFLHLLILCGLVTCNFELDFNLINYDAQSPNE